MTQIQFPGSETGAIEIAHGSDGRLNTSGRVDGRSYYVSRDRGQAFAVTFEDTGVDVGDEIFYLKNDSTDKTLVLDSIGIGSTVSTSFKLKFEVATDITGSALVPVNLNRASSNQAVVTCVGGTAALGGTSIPDGVIDMLMIGTLGHDEFKLKDRVRLGQGDAIIIQSHRGGTSVVDGVVYFYFE
jgi:hypothetical protein